MTEIVFEGHLLGLFSLGGEGEVEGVGCQNLGGYFEDGFGGKMVQTYLLEDEIQTIDIMEHTEGGGDGDFVHHGHRGQ
jgi:hypothetical protein